MRRTIRFNDAEEAVIVENSKDIGASEFVRQCVRQFDMSDKKVSDKVEVVRQEGSILQKVKERLGEVEPEKEIIEEDKTKHDFDNTIEWAEYLDTKGNRTQYGICANCHKKTHAVWGDDEWWCVNCGIGSGELAERMQ